MKMPQMLLSWHTTFDAVQEGNVAFIQHSFGHGLRPWAVNIRGRSLILVCLLKCLARAPNPNVWSNDFVGMCTDPVKEAVSSNQPQIARFLVQEGADINAEDMFGASALSMVPWLTDRTAWLRTLRLTMDDLQDRLGFSELHNTVLNLGSSPGLTRELLERTHLDVNSRDGMGMTPLHWASLLGNTTAMELLME